MPPASRVFLLFLLDILVLFVSFWLSFWLRLANPIHPSMLNSATWLLPSLLVGGILLYFFTGQYNAFTRYAGSRTLYLIGVRNIVLMAGLYLQGFIFKLPMPPRSSWALLWILLTSFLGATRIAFRDIFSLFPYFNRQDPKRVGIYGAGQAGVQLCASLRLSDNFQPVVFFDDNPTLHKRYINGLPILPSSAISRYEQILDNLFIAIPSLSISQRKILIDRVQTSSLPVSLIPSVDELNAKDSLLESLRPVSVNDLLGRDPVPPFPELLGPGITNKVVCVTGGGGSIGSELCRQILKLKPKLLVIIDNSEFSLYSLDQQLSSFDSFQIILGNVCDLSLSLVLFNSIK